MLVSVLVLYIVTVSLEVKMNYNRSLSKHLAVVDPGFPQCGGKGEVSPRGKGGLHQAIICHIFCQKLYENERIWTPGACVPGAPLDAPLRLKEIEPWIGGGLHP